MSSGMVQSWVSLDVELLDTKSPNTSPDTSPNTSPDTSPDTLPDTGLLDVVSTKKTLQGKERKKTLEEKIESKQREIDVTKEKLHLENIALAQLQKQKTLKDASQPGALKKLILSHKACDCNLEGAFAILITILSLPSNHTGRNKLLYLFPFKERGYKGRVGDCLLEGHVQFSDSEKEILRRYGIKWIHSKYGNINGH